MNTIILKRQLILFLLIHLSVQSFSQNIDSIRNEKWFSFGRVSLPETERQNENWDRQFITQKNDTLTRSFSFGYRKDYGVIISDNNLINDKLNGLSVNYYQNGKVFSIEYYLDNKPWETTFLSDSFGTLHFPGDLKNGNGRKYFISADGIDLGFITYQNGMTSGRYCRFESDGVTGLEGELLYKPALVRYDTMIITHFTYNNDTLITFSQNGKTNDDMISRLLIDDSTKSKTKILDTEALIEIQQERLIEPETLGLSLKSGVIPIGHWELSNKKTKRKYISCEFNNDGKLKTYTSFKEDGSINQHIDYK